MPRVALLLMAVWFLSLFVFRTLLHWWRTGSTGVRGFSGSVASLEWNAGLLASLGLAASGIAPVASLMGWPGGALWISSAPLHGVGAGLLCAGILGALLSQLALGDSWRIGVDASETTKLVTGGVYRFSRNPIFAFILLSALGLVALLPSVLALLAACLTFAGVELQVRAVEEPHLLKTHGEAYRAYAARTGRFVPGVGRLAGDRTPTSAQP